MASTRLDGDDGNTRLMGITRSRSIVLQVFRSLQFLDCKTLFDSDSDFSLPKCDTLNFLLTFYQQQTRQENQ